MRERGVEKSRREGERYEKKREKSRGGGRKRKERRRLTAVGCADFARNGRYWVQAIFVAYRGYRERVL